VTVVTDNKNVDIKIKCARRVSGITFIGYSKNRNIGKPNTGLKRLTKVAMQGLKKRWVLLSCEKLKQKNEQPSQNI
jgi:hypothetical protein